MEELIGSIGGLVLALVLAFLFILAVLWMMVPFMVNATNQRLKHIHNDNHKMQIAILEQLKRVQHAIEHPPGELSIKPGRFKIDGLADGGESSITVKAASEADAKHFAEKRGMHVLGVTRL